MNKTQNQTKIVKADENYLYFCVPSHSRDGNHCVKFNVHTGEWSCTCEHYFYRKAYCKHIEEAKNFLMTFAIKGAGQTVYKGRLEKETVPTVVQME